jgi:hypothetical protein
VVGVVVPPVPGNRPIAYKTRSRTKTASTTAIFAEWGDENAPNFHYLGSRCSVGDHRSGYVPGTLYFGGYSTHNFWPSISRLDGPLICSAANGLAGTTQKRTRGRPPQPSFHAVSYGTRVVIDSAVGRSPSELKSDHLPCLTATAADARLSVKAPSLPKGRSCSLRLPDMCEAKADLDARIAECEPALFLQELCNTDRNWRLNTHS